MQEFSFWPTTPPRRLGGVFEEADTVTTWVSLVRQFAMSQASESVLLLRFLRHLWVRTAVHDEESDAPLRNLGRADQPRQNPAAATVSSRTGGSNYGKRMA